MGEFEEAKEATLALDEQAYLYIVRAHDIPVGDFECLEDVIQADRLIESIYVSY